MTDKLKKVLGTMLFMAVIAASAVTMVQASKVYLFMENVRINTNYGNYSEYFRVNGSATTPYMQYKQVYTNGRYGVSTLYKNGTSDTLITAKSYYASSISQGMLLSGTEFKTSKENRILVYRYTGSSVDMVIDFIRMEY